MTYWSDLQRILTLDDSVYEELFKRRRLLPYCWLHIMVLGLLYGATALFLTRRLDLAQGGDVNAPFLLLIGVSVAFLMHGGAALFIWVFCRGIGGSTLFMPIYFNCGAAAVAAWPLAPVVAAIGAGVRDYALYGLGVIFAAYLFAVGFVAVRKASGLSFVRMSIAAAATVVYVGCFLYLWL